MEHRDYLLKQLDQFGKALVSVLSRLSGIDSNSSPSIKMELIDESLTEHLSISVQALTEMNEKDFVEQLIEEKTLNPENLRNLSTVLEIYAENCDNPMPVYKKILLIEEYVLSDSTTYSLEQHHRIQHFKALLNL